MSNCLVSVICNAYNHEKFIRDALEGFVKQKTDFEFEVLIHDDASTDGTPEIIREYELKYPHLIKPIYQTVNQYSQHIPIGKTYQLPRAQGKYIALCEGDDYWIDDYKLQKQINILENHHEYSMCAHAGYYVDESGKRKPGLFRAFKESKEVKIEEIIEKWLFPTASIVYRKEILDKSDFPKLKGAPCGDYPLAVRMALNGIVYYIDEVMSCYRQHENSAIGQRMKNPELEKSANMRFINMINELDSFTDYKYTTIFDKQRKEREFRNYILCKDYHNAKQQRYRELWKKYKNVRLKKIIIKRLPFIANLYYKIFKKTV